jgi:tRNA threonylcarbamoyl adenosine modification protein YeaZ
MCASTVLNILPHSFGLGLDTTGAVLTLALGTSEGMGRCQAWPLDREISTQLHPLLQDFMRPQVWVELAWIAVLTGPGSFTGTRIGVVTARMLAQHLQVPLFGISSLAIAAWTQAIPQGIERPWVVAVEKPGQRGTCYGAIYAIHANAQAPTALKLDQLLPIDEWKQVVQSSVQPIDQFLSLDNQPQTNCQQPNGKQLGQAILTLGWQGWAQGLRPDWREVLPYYG